MVCMQYYKAHFGAQIPSMGGMIVLADPLHACRPSRNNVTGAFVLVSRGKCTFLDKASNVSLGNASAVIVMNNEEDMYRVSAGYGLGENPENVTLPSNISVIMVRKSASMRLTEAAKNKEGVIGRLVPLECGPGANLCLPITEKEKTFVRSHAVASGILRILHTNETFEFVTSTFGTLLPVGREVNVSMVGSGEACIKVPAGFLSWISYLFTRAPLDMLRGYSLPKDGSHLAGSLALVERGGCSFASKAKNLQRTKASGLLVVSKEGLPIQNFGAKSEEVHEILVGGIMVNYDAGTRIKQVSRQVGYATVTLSYAEPCFAEKWLEISNEIWSQETEEDIRRTYETLKKANQESQERLSLLHMQFKKELQLLLLREKAKSPEICTAERGGVDVNGRID